MDSNSQDRNLPATARKLERARADGQVARSKDLSHLAVLTTGGMALITLAPSYFETVRTAFVRQMAFNAQTIAAPKDSLLRLSDMAQLGLVAALGFALLIMAASVAATLSVSGRVFSLKPISPDFSRLSPFAGLARLFSKEQFFEVSKSVLGMTVIVWIAWNYLSKSAPEVLALTKQPSGVAIAHALDWLMSGVKVMIGVIGAAAAVDLPLQIFLHRKRLRMSFEEVKQEHKESEGNPQLKGKQRAKQREISQRASINAVPKADFVVTNPTHYAVAIRYDEAKMSAPQVIAKGADLLALKMRQVAAAHDVPVLESPRLARALYAHADLDREIPATLYSAVAQVLAYVYRLKAYMDGRGQRPGQMVEPFVPPELDPHTKPLLETPAS